MPKKKLRFLIGGTLILSGIGGLIVYSFNQSLVYDHSVSEYLASPSLRASHCRIYGKVKPNTVARHRDGIGVSFAVTDGTLSIPVTYGKEVPDTFKEDGDVVVEGKLDREGVFRAANLLAKCPSKYEGEGVQQGSGAAPTPAGTGYPGS